MAENFCDEGLDYIINLYVRNTGSILATTYLNLFTSATASTVPGRTATGAPTGWTEATGTGYARKSMASTDWGAPATNASGRRTVGNQMTFATVGAGGWGTVNGFGHSSAATTGTCFWFANFDDTTAVTLNVNDIIKITPTIQLDI